MQLKETVEKLLLRKKEIGFVSGILLIFAAAAVFASLSSKQTEVPDETSATPAEYATSSDVPEEADETDTYNKLKYHKPGSSLKHIASEENDEEIFEPGPERLNLAYFYPEDADTGDAIHSYGGEIYQDLHVMNADYYASFYDLADKSPLSLANQFGLDRSRVMGKYNPQDDKHDPGNPDTWTINSFKNVSVQFYNGDGQRINGYYLAQEIMSLASVFAYYHNDYNAEHMKQYCEELFHNAISYKVSLGTVYYDEGCLNKTKSQESAEALAMEAKRIKNENALTLQTAKSSGERINGIEVFTDLTDLTLDSLEGETAETPLETTVEEIFEDQNSSASSTEVHYYEESTAASTEEASSTTGASIESETEASTAAETETAAQAETTSAAPSIEEIFDESDNTKVLGESYYAPDFYLAAEESGGAISDTPAQTTADNVIIAPTTTAPETAAAESQTSAVINAFANQNSTVEASSETVPETMSEEDLRAQEELTKRYIELLKQANVQSSAESYCPGHIDVFVKVTIRGIEDKKSLFKADKTGNDEKNFTDRWQGWTDEMIAHAKALNQQDWLEEYGLSISSINLMNPLTDSEITKYLESLPDDISEERKAIIRFALESVGNVPYYWGGKPAGAGYEVNHFYTLIEPDYHGRILKGLDCSGWINWVYWSVTGKSLAGQSTGTLIACGSRIKRSELRPGDIIIRIGDDAHVVMFLGWAEDGQFYAIHETGNIINNVTVSKLTANWPYYRSLIK